MSAPGRIAEIVGLALLLVCAGAAQEPDGDPLTPLRQGQLIVWVMQPAASASKQKGVVLSGIRGPTDMGYHEQTAGSFGQSASSYGTNAGGYGVDASSPTISASNAMPDTSGHAPPPNPDQPSADSYHEQTAGSFGQAAGSYGTAASNHGQTTGSLGQTAGSYGTAASNYGQTAGSFGHSLNAIPPAGVNANAPQAEQNPLREKLAEQIQAAFPDLRIQYADFYAADLGSRLKATEGTSAYPDLLIGSLPAEWWNNLQKRYGLAMLWPAVIMTNGLGHDESSAPEFAILAAAPHPKAARAFALWMSEGDVCAGCVQQGLSKRAQNAATVAVGSVRHLLQGEVLGDTADPAMAQISPQRGRALLLTTQNGVADDAAVRIEVVHSSTHADLAVVALRVVASSNQVFGLLHPLVVLRRANGGPWRVLHISMNLPPFEQHDEQGALMATSPPTAAEQRAGVKGVSQAAPMDGDSRPPQPELWWDNGGGAGLQVVEWQRSHDSAWSDAHLYLVSDTSQRLRTRVTAQFAREQGRYRWRVWSVGAEGEMKISSWRTLNIVPR